MRLKLAAASEIESENPFSLSFLSFFALLQTTSEIESEVRLEQESEIESEVRLEKESEIESEVRLEQESKIESRLP